MELITSKTLESIIVEQKKKSEGLLPELVKRLVLSSCPDVSNIRIPGMDDIWAPGFDGTVINKEEFKYVSSGQSVWEFGTNADSLEKINSDYKKRTDNFLGFDKADTTFYLVIPKIWAYKSSISKWENGHKRDWKNIHVYDASVLCDWINSEPAVCAWLFEAYYEERKLDFSSVDCAWEKLANRTMPSFSHTIFTKGRDEQIELFLNTVNKKICRVKAETMVDAYGFCLSSLLHDPIKANTIIVVYNEDTYRCLTRIVREKIFLLHFPFSGHVSDDNSAILCFSREAVSLPDAIVLQPLWKTQLVKAMCDMNIPDYQASELYAFTHGNLLSLIRRIPGNSAENRPKWVNVENIDY